MKKFQKFVPFLTMLILFLAIALPVFAEDPPAPSFDSSSVLTTISTIVSANWPTIIGIVGLLIGVSLVIRLIKKAAGR